VDEFIQFVHHPADNTGLRGEAAEPEKTLLCPGVLKGSLRLQKDSVVKKHSSSGEGLASVITV
jgi:hypothetical protein